MYWDELKEEKVLKEYETSYVIMIDNTKILELARAELKLKNPNYISK